jgi:Protein of unknown function (DUF2281)
MEQAILEQLQQLPEAAQAEALRYIEGLVAQHTAAASMQNVATRSDSTQPIPKKRQAGMMKGTFVLPLPEDFNAPLEDFQEYME